MIILLFYVNDKSIYENDDEKTIASVNWNAKDSFVIFINIIDIQKDIPLRVLTSTEVTNMLNLCFSNNINIICNAFLLSK